MVIECKTFLTAESEEPIIWRVGIFHSLDVFKYLSGML